MTVDGFVASVLVTPTIDTVEEIAQALAAQINGNFGLTHEAVATGGQLMIAKKDGTTPLAVGTLSITGGAIPGSGLVAGVSSTVFAPASGSWTLGFQGVPVGGEVWELTFDGVTKSLTVTAGMDLEDVVAGLAALWSVL